MNTEALADVYRRYLRCLNNRQWDELGQFVCEDVTHNQKPIGLTGYRAISKAIPLRYLICTFSRSFSSPTPMPAAAFQCTPQQPFLGFEPTVRDLIRRSRLLSLSRRQDRRIVVVGRRLSHRRTADRLM